MHILLKTNNKEVKVNIDNLEKKGSGEEGNVYKYRGYAIKVYDEIQKKYLLTYKDVENMLNFDTKRILTPIGHVYNIEDLLAYFNGYATKYIDDQKDFSDIYNISSNILDSELKIITNDVYILSANRVLVNDLISSGNIIYNGNIYFNDPGSLKFDNSDYNDIYIENIEYIGKVIHHHLICLQKNSEYIKKELASYEFIKKDELNIHIAALVKNIFVTDINNINDKNYIKHIRNILDKYGSIKNYKYHLLKEYSCNKNVDEIYTKSIKKILK